MSSVISVSAGVKGKVQTTAVRVASDLETVALGRRQEAEQEVMER